MRRVIKFRAWFEEKQEMRNVAMSNIYKGKSDYLYLSPMPGSNYQVIKPMQFTGLHDKNGMEIYEGDVVNAASQGSHAKCTVKWGQGRAGFFLHAPGICWNLSGGGEKYNQETVEVIGNIYEHPYLLQEK